MEIGEIGSGAGGAFERFDVGRELDEIAGDEACGEPKMTQDLNKQPRRVTTGAGAFGERLCAGLDAGLHADYVADFALQSLVESDEEIDGADFCERDGAEPASEIGAGGFFFEIGAEIAGERGVVSERVIFGGGFEKEIERIVDRHLRDEIDFDEERGCGLGEDETREIVALRVLLPVDEVATGLNLQRIRKDRRAAVRSGTQTDDLRTEFDAAVVTIFGFMIQSNVNRHRSRSERLILRAQQALRPVRSLSNFRA